VETVADAIEYKRVSLDQITRPAPAAGAFVHSVLSFTRLEIPQIEVYETAVTFDATTDPLTAHDALADVFGHKAGSGYFLFRADSAIPGRYWVRSIEPWTRWPAHASSALEPKRIVIQLAEGLMYRFTLPVCAGREFIDGKEKRVEAYTTVEQIDTWFAEQARDYGMRPLLVNVSLETMRFSHRNQRFKIPYASIEGALEVGNATAMQRRLVKGFGSYRRTGLGMMQLSA
jgi:CRISPR-associated protein Cas6/Cse3/CasE subtype I-E